MDPWEEIQTPSAVNSVNALRVNAGIPWGFFWARDIDGKCILFLQHNIDSSPQDHLPKLKGMEVCISEGSKEDERILVFRLLDFSFRDIFHKLCVDIIDRSSVVSSEREAVSVAVARTWRWHHLLRGGGNGLLSPEEQKGLLGELFVLEKYILPIIPTFDALVAWQGPLGSPKDFEIGRVSIEAKARRGGARPFISISSEHQLDDSGVDALYLYVVELDRATSGSPCGFRISDVIDRIRDQISEADHAALEKFESLILATGFRWEDDYSDFLWVEGSGFLYKVAEGFPRISASNILQGVRDVKYNISLPECRQYAVENQELETELRRINHGN